jgi:hypothetical protein
LVFRPSAEPSLRYGGVEGFRATCLHEGVNQTKYKAAYKTLSGSHSVGNVLLLQSPTLAPSAEPLLDWERQIEETKVWNHRDMVGILKAAKA